jgi:hypothetical protein
VTPYKLKLRYGQSQEPTQMQNSLTQVGASSERMKPAAEIGKFQQFNAESGKYTFNGATQSVEVSPAQMLSNGKLCAGQRVLLSQGTADFIPA